ncbi:MAG: hypothetical protein K2X29_11055 [Candidatus Obscuribacterales bacterium]|nr:hypothetical protein [Candidatus Obscuribacterales bacterium]
MPPPVLRQTPSIDTSRYPDLGVPSPANPQLQSEDLTRLYLRNRERIDTNHDGELSRGELDSAMINPNFRGEDAQAVAFLRSQHNALTGQYDDPRAGITEADMAVYDDRQRQGRENLTRANQIHYGTENFDSLDSNHDGRLTNNELDSALQNQQLTAEQRGSLQEIRNHSGEIANARNDGQGNGISRDDLQSHENDLRQRRNSRIASSVDGALHQSGERIAGTNHDAFGGRPPLESIRPEAVRQGTEGDCALQATLASMARTNPGAIRDMIHDNQDGTYTVTFPGDRRHPVRVAAPTDSELAAYGGGSEYGTWPAIIERAYGVHENPNVTVPGDVAAHSGDTEEHTRRTMELLTGHHAHDSEVAEMSDPELQRVLARSNRHPVTALVNGDTRWSDNVQPGSGLQGTHAYSVVGYDPHTHQVTLRNPWGQGEIGGRGHARDGHDDGTFTMSYEEFRRYISRVNY